MDICVEKKKVKLLEKLYGIAKGKAAGFADGKAAGFADGKAIGFADGKVAGILEIARSLKKNGMDIHEISKITGLSLDELKNL